jgi:hypothetical protein
VSLQLLPERLKPSLSPCDQYKKVKGKNMKKLINALGILGLGLLLSIYPYKIYQEKKNLDNLNQWLANPENKEFLFNENLQLIEVENLGNDI